MTFSHVSVDLGMCLSVNTKLINTHPRVPVPYLWDRPSRKKSDLVFVGGLSQRTKIMLYNVRNLRFLRENKEKLC